MAASATPANPCRTCCNSVWYRASASNSLIDVCMIVKVLLQNDGGGLRVDKLAAPGLDHGRRIALVDQGHRQAETAVQLVGETAAAQCHLVFGAVRVERLAHHQ